MELIFPVQCAVEVQFHCFLLWLTHFPGTICQAVHNTALLSNCSGPSDKATVLCVGRFLASLSHAPFVCLWTYFRFSCSLHHILQESLDNSTLVVIWVFTIKFFSFFSMFEIFLKKILGEGHLGG